MKKANPTGNTSQASTISISTPLSLIEKITNLVPGLIAVYNINTGQYVYVNDSIKKMLGYTKEEWLGKGLPFVSTLVHPDDVETIMKKNIAALKKANSKNHKDLGNDPIVDFEYRLRHKDGTWRWLKTDGVVFDRNEKKMVEHVMNISIDITERRTKEEQLKIKQEEAQDELATSRNQLDAVLKNIADGVTVQDLQGKLIYANTVAARFSGYKSPEEMLRAPIKDVLNKFIITDEHDEPLTATDLPGRRAITGEKDPQAIIKYTNKKTKEVKWSIVHASLINRNGKPFLIVNTIQDITALKKIEHDQARLAAIVESSADAIISKNLKSIIISWNKGAERMFGHKAHEAIGKPITLIIPPELRGEEATIIKKLKKGMSISHFQTVRITKDGRKIDVSLSISPIKNSENQIIGASKIARDITEQKMLEKQRDDFISIATHELKTPVTSVKAYAQVLHGKFLKKDDAKSAGYLAKMDAQLNKLTSLIGDLLNVNKLQSGQLHFSPQSFDINTLVDEITEELQRTTERHKIMKKLEPCKDVFADRDRIGQVITNLISNAIKYSPNADKIIVTSSCGNDVVVVCVRDYGIGIPREKLDKVFDKFFRISGPKNETFPGMGLGLHISSEFIRRQGGKIWAKSTEGKGSRFYFSLPIHKKLRKKK